MASLRFSQLADDERRQGSLTGTSGSGTVVQLLTQMSRQLDGLEDGLGREGLGDIEDLLYLRLEVQHQKHGLLLAKRLECLEDYPNPHAADVVELRHVKPHGADILGEYLLDVFLEFRRGLRIEPSIEHHLVKARLLLGDHDRKGHEGLLSGWSRISREKQGQHVFFIRTFVLDSFRDVAEQMDAEASGRSILHGRLEVGRRGGHGIELVAVVDDPQNESRRFEACLEKDLVAPIIVIGILDDVRHGLLEREDCREDQIGVGIVVLEKALQGTIGTSHGCHGVGNDQAPRFRGIRCGQPEILR